MILFGDWYNVSVMKKVKFYDENTRQWWMPDTGGANIPALNDLMAQWGIAFGGNVYEGPYKLGDHDMNYASGTHIVKFPPSGIVINQRLVNQGIQIIDGTEEEVKSDVTILGLYQTEANNGGRIIVYGDSNCLDTSHLTKACYWMLAAFLDYTSTNHLPQIFKDNSDSLQILDNNIIQEELPKRMEGSRLYRYSKVLDNHLGGGGTKTRPLPQCPHLVWAQPMPLNHSAPTNLYKSQKLLSLTDEQIEQEVAESMQEHNKKHDDEQIQQQIVNNLIGDSDSNGTYVY